MATETDTNNITSGGLAIWCITPNGRLLGEKIQTALPGSVLFLSQKICQETIVKGTQVVFNTLATAIDTEFKKHQNHVFIFSTGIAVRMVAPLLVSKLTDPAVVVVDDNANFAISLVSGHIGGANALAHHIAGITNAVPVITTATDTNHLPAIDMIAKSCNLHIETPENIKHINMAFLKNQPVALYDPQGILQAQLPEKHRTDISLAQIGLCDLFCSHETHVVPRETLVLRPRTLSIGIGCNRNTSHEEIERFMRAVLDETGLSAHSIGRLSTTDVKADEKGLLSLAKSMKLELSFYTKQELNSVTTITSPSKMAQKHLGVNSVCEASAILSANNGNLIVPKKKNKDVTIAVAIIK